MEMVYQILALVGAGLLVWVSYRTIKGRPDLFTRDTMNKSLYSLGMLALVLIAFVALLVLFVRH